MRLRLALLHRAVHRADVAVHDADALVGAAGVFLRPLAYLDPLDEQPQQLRRQLVDGGILLRLLNERVHVGGGGFQLFQPGLLFGDLFLQRFLFDGVIARQHPVLLIGHPPQYIVLIEPLEQLGQFLSASPHGIQIFLDRVHLTPQLQRILAADVGGELLFLHPREVRHPAQVLQHNGFQFKLPDVMRRADGLALFAVGVALEVVLRPLHRAGSVQHQRLAAIRAEHQSREDVRLVHVLGDTLFVLTHLLHDVPLLLRDEGFVGVLHHEPLTFGALHALLVFVGDRSGAKSNRVSEVDLIVQNAGDAVGRPQAWSGGVQSPMAFPGLAVVGVGRVHHLLLGEDGGDPLGAVSSGAEGEDALHHRCGVLVRNQRVGVTITFPIAVGRSAAQPLSLLRFHFHDRADLAAGILGVKLVGPVADGVEVIAALHCGIHAIVDSDEADILLGKIYLHVVAHLKVFSPQAGGVLYDEVRHLSRFDHLHDLFP